MNIRCLALSIVAVATMLNTGCGTKSREKHKAASELANAMLQEVFDTQKAIIQQFKSLPEASSIRVGIEGDLDPDYPGFNNYAVSEDRLASNINSETNIMNGWINNSQGGEWLAEFLYHQARIRVQGEQQYIDGLKTTFARIDSDMLTLRLDRRLETAMKIKIMTGLSSKKKLLPLEIQYHESLMQVFTQYEQRFLKLHKSK